MSVPAQAFFNTDNLQIWQALQDLIVLGPGAGASQQQLYEVVNGDYGTPPAKAFFSNVGDSYLDFINSTLDNINGLLTYSGGGNAQITYDGLYDVLNDPYLSGIRDSVDYLGTGVAQYVAVSNAYLADIDGRAQNLVNRLKNQNVATKDFSNATLAGLVSDIDVWRASNTAYLELNLSMGFDGVNRIAVLSYSYNY
jgi:hypothetical protein